MVSHLLRLLRLLLHHVHARGAPLAWEGALGAHHAPRCHHAPWVHAPHAGVLHKVKGQGLRSVKGSRGWWTIVLVTIK